MLPTLEELFPYIMLALGAFLGYIASFFFGWKWEWLIIFTVLLFLVRYIYPPIKRFVGHRLATHTSPRHPKVMSWTER